MLCVLENVKVGLQTLQDRCDIPNMDVFGVFGKTLVDLLWDREIRPGDIVVDIGHLAQEYPEFHAAISKLSPSNPYNPCRMAFVCVKRTPKYADMERLGPISGYVRLKIYHKRFIYRDFVPGDFMTNEVPTQLVPTPNIVEMFICNKKGDPDRRWVRYPSRGFGKLGSHFDCLMGLLPELAGFKHQYSDAMRFWGEKELCWTTKCNIRRGGRSGRFSSISGFDLRNTVTPMY